MAYRFRKNEALPHAIRRVFSEQIDWAVGQLTNPKDKREAVHEARKSIKKTRALLGLVKSPLGPEYKRGNRHFRKAGRLLSEVRDAQVVLDVFDDLSAKDGQMDAQARQEIRHHLQRTKQKAPSEKEVSARVVRLLDETRPLPEKWSLEALDLPALSPDLLAAYRCGRNGLKAARQAGSAEAFHDFRKAVKQHWYHLKLLENICTPVWKQRAAELRDLETALGDEHNLTVLRERIQAHVETSSDRRHAQRFLAILQVEALGLRQRALEIGTRLYAAKPRAFGETLAKLWAHAAIPRKRAAAAPSKARSAVA